MSAVLVLLNPRAAGGRAGRSVAAVRDVLSGLGVEHRLEVPESVDSALVHVRAMPRGSRVVLLGGDGSLQPLLSSLIDGEYVLGMVPLGSGNDFARALGCVGWGLREALAHAVRGLPTPVDTGEVVLGGRRIPFASSLAGGFDAAVGVLALEGPRWLTGQVRYLWATARALANLQCCQMTTLIDGKEWAQGEMLFASVLNTPSYGSGMPAVPHARLADGRLDAILAGRFDRLGTLNMLPRLLLGRHLKDPRVRTLAFTDLEVHASTDVPLAADGEPLGMAREWRVRVLPGSLRVVVGTEAAG